MKSYFKKPFPSDTTSFLQLVFATVSNSLTWHFRKRNRPVHLCGLIIYTSLPLLHPRFDYSCRIFFRYLKKIELYKKSILDYNAGSGWLSVYAAQKGAFVSAFDRRILAKAVVGKNSIANDVSKNVTVLPQDEFDIAIAGLVFDFIFIQPQSAADSVNDALVEKLIARAGKILAPGGKIVFLTHAAKSPLFLQNELQAKGLLLHHCSTFFFASLTLFEITKADAAC